MSTPGLRLAGSGAGAHPALASRRMHDVLLTGSTGLIALMIAMGISLEVPKPNAVLVGAFIVGTVGILALMISTRYEVTLTLVVLYLGLLDGPVKLLSASTAASAARDVLIFAVAIGMLVRMSVSRQSVKMPPLSGWVIAFVGAVVVQAFNPQTASILKVLGGFRQQLEWIPFFFFGYTLLRSKASFRKLFLVFGVIALANGVVGVYQSRLSPGQLGSWGPGYNARINGTGGVSGRTYVVEGVARPRPPALGSDSGFGGGIGILALPGLIALLSTGQLRRRWIAMLFCAGALLGIATAASRSSVIIAVIALLSYAGLSLIAGLKVTRLFAGLLAAMALSVGVGAFLIAEEGNGIFKRQETVTSISSAENSGASTKVEHIGQIFNDIKGAPFGIGLGTGGSAGGFGGKQKVQIEGQGASGEGALNLVVIETGLPGLLLWIGLSVSVMSLVVRRLRSVADIELRTYLVAAFAVYLAFTAEGFAGPTLAVSPAGTYLWLAPGIAAYWLAGPGRTASRATAPASEASPMIAAPVA
jgi:hypothetical protein